MLRGALYLPLAPKYCFCEVSGCQALCSKFWINHKRGLPTVHASSFGTLWMSRCGQKFRQYFPEQHWLVNALLEWRMRCPTHHLNCNLLNEAPTKDQGSYHSSRLNTSLKIDWKYQLYIHLLNLISFLPKLIRFNSYLTREWLRDLMAHFSKI